MEQLLQLYKSYAHENALSCTPLPGAGSNRKYYRLRGSSAKTVVGVVGTSRDENHAFCYLSQHFSERRLPVPKVLAVSSDGLRYLQTDLGDLTLFQALEGGRLAHGRYNQHERQLLRNTMALLPSIQIRGARGLDFSNCYPQEGLDATNVLFDLNYFKYCFLKATGLDFHELKLEASFQLLVKDILSLPADAFMYRDFQARNVMLDANNNPYFIDFQGGRRGPVQYDVASFLWQASANYPDVLRQELISVYLKHLKLYVEVNEKEFYRGLRLCLLFRLLQVLGAYGFRGYFERKSHFLNSIPPAMRNLRQLLDDGGCPYPYLHDVLSRMVDLPQFKPEEEKPQPRADGYRTAPSTPYTAHPQDGPATFSKYDGRGPLVVNVWSFSFRKGIPADPSGNGGGYVFDCRSTHNPGRYEPYKNLTGLDEPVIRFLEDDGEILTFLESVYRLADAHVLRYIQRGFTSLMFCFGCTGGQHRSVYSAQHLAEHIHNKFGVEVHVHHREQGVEQILSPVRAMIFAAGLGTRLKPLTNSMPKALVPVDGKPLLQHQLEKIRSFGCRDVVINVHHFADMIEQWVKNNPMDMSIRFSDERAELLDTGGGIKHAASMLEGASDGFLIHNVDILSNVDLRQFVQAASLHDATLLVSERSTQRYLLFDEDLRLVGWTNVVTGQVRSPYPDLDVSKCNKLAFAGVHYMKPTLFGYFDEWPLKFGIIDFYLKICDRVPIYGYVQPGLKIMDVGKSDTLQQADRFVETL